MAEIREEREGVEVQKSGGGVINLSEATGWDCKMTAWKVEQDAYETLFVQVR